MRSSRNASAVAVINNLSLIDWKMRSSRNQYPSEPIPVNSLIDWKMRSSRNPLVTCSTRAAKFNRLENAL